jgi:flavin reductase (DIM6/NTAB) family NADH-FMN oxidoreductase RutF
MRISEQIFPRVVALISSTDGKRDNVMTASFLMPISFEPKYLAFSVSPKRRTFENLKKIKEFTLNILSEEMKEIAKICGSYSGKEIDKFELAKLEKEKSKFVKPPMIKNCPISFECKIELMKEFGDHYLIVGKVLNETVRKKNFKPLLHKTGEIFPKLE